MKDWKDLELQELRWIQSDSWGWSYALCGEDGEPIASMRRPHWWNEYIEIDAPGNRWSFSRKGFFNRRIEIKSIGTGDEPATYSYSGSRLEFKDGRVYFWRRSNFWATKWAWVDEDGQPLVGFETGGMMRLRGDLSIPPEATELPSLALLVFLGWYLTVLNRQDTSAAVVVAAT